MGDGWSAEAGGAAEAVGAVDVGRSQSRPHGRPTVTKPPSPSEPKTYFMERKAFIILIRRFLYVFILHVEPLK